MKVFILLTSLLYATARPSWEHQHKTPLEGVPNEQHYGKLTYPTLDFLDLGTSVKNTLPPIVVEIRQKEVIKVPKPYPVKVPVPVPHPIEVPKPFPVIQTKIVKVPEPYPVPAAHHQPEEGWQASFNSGESHQGYPELQGSSEAQYSAEALPNNGEHQDSSESKVQAHYMGLVMNVGSLKPVMEDHE